MDTGGAHEAPHLTEELLETACCLGRDSHFFRYEAPEKLSVTVKRYVNAVSTKCDSLDLSLSLQKTHMKLRGKSAVVREKNEKFKKIK